MSWLSSPHRQSAKGLLNFQHFPIKNLLRLCADKLQIPHSTGTYCHFHAAVNKLTLDCHSAVGDCPRFRVPEEGNKKEARLTVQSLSGPRHPQPKECNDSLPD